MERRKRRSFQIVRSVSHARDRTHGQHLNAPGIQPHHMRHGISPHYAPELVVCDCLRNDPFLQAFFDRRFLPAAAPQARGFKVAGSKDDEAAGATEGRDGDGPGWLRG